MCIFPLTYVMVLLSLSFNCKQNGFCAKIEFSVICTWRVYFLLFILGYVIAGFHNYGPKTETFELTDTKEVCKKIMVRGSVITRLY